MALGVWHHRLEKHFVSISASRQSTGWPVFALEHGLSSEELPALLEEVRRSVQHTSPPDSAWLPWIVYGAEQGYVYDGDEYWQSFEEATPGWVVHGDRHWLRQRFVRFCQKFGGAKPSGVWAAHFSIICWPITHAILPRDLQYQLARVLYELRHSFTVDLLRAPELLGTRIRAAGFAPVCHGPRRTAGTAVDEEHNARLRRGFDGRRSAFPAAKKLRLVGRHVVHGTSTMT